MGVSRVRPPGHGGTLELMRTLLIITSVAATVVASAATGAVAPSTSRPTVAPGYNVRATFSGSLLVSWGFETGSETQACTMWAKGGGINKFEASSLSPSRAYLQLGSGLPQQPWAGLTLRGKARGKVERSITIHASGVNWSESCGGTRPSRPSSVDCGERSFDRIPTFIFAGDAPFEKTLDAPDLMPSGARSGLSDLLLVTVARGAEPFSSCDIPSFAQKPYYAPTFMQSVPLRIDDVDEAALKGLDKGKRYRIFDRYGGQCTAGVPARSCAFVLDLSIMVKRV